MADPLLHIRDLSIDFISAGGKNTPAVKHISLTVNRGEILALVGESGSGKSVTALSILQLLPAPPAVFPSGKILLHLKHGSLNLLKANRGKIREIRGHQVAMIFQECMTALNPVLSCGFQVMEAIQQHKKITAAVARKQTIALFEKVKLPNPGAIFKRYPHQLSGGQRQRVMIAMAMSCEPALLICDEPTTALDVTVQKNILGLLRELQQQNQMGIIFITHDLGVVSAIADRVAVMYKGSIVEENTTHLLFQSPRHPYTRALLACRPVLHQKAERLPVVSDFLNNTYDDAGNTRPALQHREHERKPVQETSIHQQARPILAVSGLSVWYPLQKNFWGKPVSYTRAVDAVSFNVYEGETLGLVGESGCGKSTLGRAILRLTDTRGGNILYKGTDLLNIGAGALKHLRKDMQLVFQDPYSSLNPRMTIGDAIAEPLAVHGMIHNKAARKEAVVELLEKVNLKPEHYGRYPHEFSGGQRQRIVIARALVLRPSFVICDESVSALDVSVQAQVLNLLNDLKKEFGFTTIFISHDLSVVRYISDRIMVMNSGRIIETGPAEEVYNNPRDPYTQQLIAATPR